MRSSPSTAAEGWRAGTSLRRKTREAAAERGMETMESTTVVIIDGAPAGSGEEQSPELGERANPRARAAGPWRPADPAERDPRANRGLSVRRGIVADVERLLRPHVERAQRDLEDARVRLREAAAFRGDHGSEEAGEAGGREARALHAVDAVRD